MLRDYQQKLFDDIRNALKANQGVCGVLPCRSGKSYIMKEMADKCAAKGGHCLILAHRRILLAQHAKMIGSARLESVFTEANHLGEKGPVNLIIIDEAHVSGCETYQKVCSYYSGAKRVLFTATPARLDGKPLSLATALVCGPSADELIAKGDIAPYDLYAPKIGVDLSTARMSGADWNESDLDRIMTDKKIYGGIIQNYEKLAAGRQAIAYCASVNHACQVRDLFEASGIPACEMDAKTPEKERERMLADYKKGRYRVLCNCNLISEGITLPDCDCAMLLRPTQSLTLYIQQSCRCLTPRPGKRAVIIDFVGNCFAHGMPTEAREWSLSETVKAPNPSREDDVLVRICGNCFRAYPSEKGRICPFCGFDNGKTPREVKQDAQAELERVQAIERKTARIEQGRAQTMEELMEVARKRGYKNPWAWAHFVYNGRKR